MISQNVRGADPESPLLAQYSERTVCSGTAGRDAHFIEYHRHTGEREAAKCSFFGAFYRNDSRQVKVQVVLPSFIVVSQSAACMLSETHAPDPTPSTWWNWFGIGIGNVQQGSCKRRIKEVAFVAINVRDLILLQFGLEQKFLTLDQIGAMFFPENREVFNWPMKCVRKLVKEGLLSVEKPGFCKPALYRVTGKGAALLRRHGQVTGLGAIEKIDTRSWEHDLWVTDTRIVFSRGLGLQHWKSERVLKQENIKKKVPDGVVSFKDKDLIIEVERTLKKKEYYEKILLDTCIRQFRNEEIILYIMANETDKRWLMKLAGGWVRIYFAMIKDLRELKDSVAFVNAEGKKFILQRKEDYSYGRSDERFGPDEDEIT